MYRGLWLPLFMCTFLCFHSLGQDIRWTDAERAYLDSHDTLWYGYTPNWAPIDFINFKGQHDGAARDMAEIIERRTGLTLEAYPGLDWNSSVASLVEGRIQLILVVRHSDQRQELFELSKPVFDIQFGVITRKDVDYIEQLEQLDGKVITMPKQYQTTTEVRRMLPNAKFILTRDVEESLLRVASGQADATIAPMSVARYYINRIGHKELQISGKADLPNESLEIAAQKGDTVLIGVINKIVDATSREEVMAIQDKWAPEKVDARITAKTIKILLWSAAGLMLCLAIIGFWSYSLKREVNRRRKLELLLRESLDQIKDKNQELTDSIQYAKRIQDAILPSPKLVKERLPNSFILYMPKDIIAGDFYWMEAMDQRVYFAAADCTGHGVPGAMVSVIGANSLNKALVEEKLTTPSDILEKTSELLTETLQKHGTVLKDGMDIALCALVPTESGSAVPYTLDFAGANNALYIVRRTQEPLKDEVSIKPKTPVKTEFMEGYAIHEIKGSKRPIGFFSEDYPFVNHHLELLPGDTIYLFSDGYADQFGGSSPEHPDGKKFKYSRLKELLCSIQHLDMTAQRQQLIKTFHEWKGDLEQVDDVCVIGVRV